MANRAYYSSSIDQFLLDSVDSIIGKITQEHSQDIVQQQSSAWDAQIEILQTALKPFPNGHILFEVQIPRMGRRADAVFIFQDIIFLMEFKVGAKHYASQDLRQAHGYALDLHHFHEGSHNKCIIPILIATKAPAAVNNLLLHRDLVFDPICANVDQLGDVLIHCIDAAPNRESIEYQTWLNSSYKPTPTIIEAAQALYSSHNVSDIARNDAGAQNLHVTSQAIQQIVHSARINKRKTICFVTGVPGAGKTLVGLNIATSSTNTDDDEHAVFLSGNGPLVEVLTEALARDSLKRNPNSTKANELRSASAKIQNIHKFRDESLKDLHKAPPERVVIFDEAQRAWDLENTSKFMIQKRKQKSFDQSEPEFLISVMDRHPDWCAIVALIGGGQEINTGETGLQGWVDALTNNFANWDIYYSDKLTQLEYAGRDISFKGVEHAYPKASLHLTTSMRSFRAEKLSHMVHYLIHNQPETAAACYQEFKHKFPIKITRDLCNANAWIKSQARANETKA
jgi:hypothetical protein